MNPVGELKSVRPYLPSIATPQPTIDDDEYWLYCEKRELRIQRCRSCELDRFPPKPLCQRCYSADTEWILLPGSGTIFTYTVVHHVVEDALTGISEYNIVVVDLDGAEGVRLLSNLIDQTPAIGMPVTVAWEQMDGVTLPRFRRRTLDGELSLWRFN